MLAAGLPAGWQGCLCALKGDTLQQLPQPAVIQGCCWSVSGCEAGQLPALKGWVQHTKSVLCQPAGLQVSPS